MRIPRFAAAPFTAALTLSLTASTAALGQEQRPATRPVPASQREIDLRPKFEPGQEIRYEMRTDSRASMKIPRTQISDDTELFTHMQQRIDLLLKVIEVEPEVGATVEVEIKGVSVKIDSNGYSGSYDTSTGKAPSGRSKRPSNDFERLLPTLDDTSLQTLVDEMVGTITVIRIDPVGNITSLNAPSKLSGASSPVINQTAIGLMAPRAGGIGIPFGHIVSVGHPTGLVKVREEWTNTDQLGGAGERGMILTTTHKLRSATGKMAKVEFNGRLQVGTSEAALKKGSYKGDYDWDTSLGQLFSMDLSSDLVMDLGSSTATISMNSGIRRQR